MFKTTIKYLTTETSIHGFKFLTNKKVNKILRVFWFLILLLSISGLLWYARSLYLKFYINPEINVRVKLKAMSEIPFPAVTICDPVFAKDNLFNYIRSFNKKSTKRYQNLSIEEKQIMAANVHVCAPHLGFFYQHFEDNRPDYDIVKILNDSALTTDEFFLLCSYRKILVNDCKSIFNKVLTDYGFCHTANMQGYNTIFNKNILSKDFDSYKRQNVTNSWFKETSKLNDDNETIIWTLDNGFIDSSDNNIIPKRASKQNFIYSYLYISGIDKENYCPQLGQIFKIIFHLPNEMPTIFNKEFSLEIGHQKLMFLNAKFHTSDESLRSYSPKQRHCYFEGERKLKFFKSYTKSHCDWECVTNYTLALCGCVKFSMPRTKNTPVCDMKKKKCYYDAMLAWPNNRSFYEDNDNACDCYQTCNDIKYEVYYEDDAMFQNFYSSTYLKSVFQKIYKISENFESFLISGGEYSYLRLQFKSHLIEVHEKYASYTLQSLIADFGGLLGLFMGCSLLSIVEIVFLLIHLFSKVNKVKNFDELQTRNDHKSEKIQMFSSNEVYHLNNPNYLLSKQDFHQMNKNMRRMEKKIDDLQIQYNVEILSTILQYKKVSK